jgi:hypothetical protein
MLKESLLAAALALPAWHGDKESEADRSARLTVIAQAIDDAVAIATCRGASGKRTQAESERSKSERSPAQAEAPKAQAAPEGTNVEVEAKVKPDQRTASASPSQPVSPSAGVTAEGERGVPNSVPEGAKTESSKTEGAKGGTSEGTRCKRIWAGTQRELGFLLLAQAFFETRLALHVHQGNCRKEIGECDSGRAISLWQLHAGYRLPVERWRELAGTDLESTREAALEATRALARSYNFCGTTEGAVANYATGRGCVWKPAEERLKFAGKLTEKYYRSSRARAASQPRPAVPGS